MQTAVRVLSMHGWGGQPTAPDLVVVVVVVIVDTGSDGSITLVLLTGECALRNINHSLERLGQFKSLKEQPVVLRVETEA